MNLARFARLSTEKPNPRSRRLDRLTPVQIVDLMNREDKTVPLAIARQRRAIARAIERIVGSLSGGGTLFFVGAGTSGRLGVIEAAECPPTFNTSPRQVRAIMAGGRAAVFRSKEGAEDSLKEGQGSIQKRVRNGDVVVGVAASGVTPFVRRALETAHRLRAATILLTCNPASVGPRAADVVIALDTGPELLTGSTRLKAGSACKMVLNMLTTGSMVRMGKVYGHWMVDLQPKSGKLVARGLRLIRELGGTSEREAERLFHLARGRVKVAIVMARRRINRESALRELARANGFLGKTLWH